MSVSEEVKKVLRRQKYKLLGKNAAAKLCHWTRESILGKGACYKQQFYGIESHRCLQVSPCVASCNQNCLFCWRIGDFAPAVGEEDEPEGIIDAAFKAQKEMVSGYGGVECDAKRLAEAKKPTNAAISLSGEPTLYSKLGELIEAFHERGMTTFVVSNGSNPDAIRKIEPTQLYVSVIAPDEASFKELGRPVRKDAWKRFNESLEALKEKKCRTVLRFTLVKGFNMADAAAYAPLVKKASPLFVELKSYMHVGYSTHRLGKENQPSFEEVKAFASALAHETQYLYTEENKISKAVLLCREAGAKRLLDEKEGKKG